MKGVNIQKKMKNIEENRKVDYDMDMAKKNQIMEKVILNKSTEQLKMKKKRTKVETKDVEIA